MSESMTGVEHDLYLARLWLARREQQVDAAKELHRTATPRHEICVTCGERFPCATWEALTGGSEVISA